MFVFLLLLAGVAHAGEDQSFAEMKVNSSDGPRIQRIWRSGNLLRLETDGDADWGGRRIEIINGAHGYTLDEASKVAWHIPNDAPDGVPRAPVFKPRISKHLEALEFGREAEFFQRQGARNESKPGDRMLCGHDSDDCTIFTLRLDGLTLTLGVGDNGLPKDLRLTGVGLAESVIYMKYARQPFDPGMFKLPSGYKVSEGTRGRPITGKEPGTDMSAFFAQESGGPRFFNEVFCRRRPVLYYFFVPGSGEGEDERRLDLLHEKFGRSRACVIPVPVSGPSLDPHPGTGAWLAARRPRYPVYQVNGSAWLPDYLTAPAPPAVLMKTVDGFSRLGGKGPLNFDDALRSAERIVNDGSDDSKVVPDDEFARWMADPERVEMEIQSKEVRALMDREDFSALDAMARRLRVRKERFSSGVWKLNVYYNWLTATALSTEAERVKRLKFLNAWIKAYPESAAPRVALAEIWLHYAFMGRGGAWSSELSRNQVRHLDDRLAVCQGILREARALQEKDPQLYVVLLKFAKAAGWSPSDARTAYREGAAWFPGYQYLHEQMANYLDPRWHGDLGDFEELMRKVAEENAEGLGDEQYTRVALLMHSELRFAPYGERFFEVSDYSWPRVKKGFLDMEKRYPGSKKNLSYFAFFASIAKDRPAARKLFARIGDDYAAGVWGNRVNYEHWRSWARYEPPVFTGPFGAEMPVEKGRSPLYGERATGAAFGRARIEQLRELHKRREASRDERRRKNLERERQRDERQRRVHDPYRDADKASGAVED